jgi:hypothetical protein
MRKYTPAIDMWGAGCVFGEMFKRKPILAGQSDIHQAQIIFELVLDPLDAVAVAAVVDNTIEGIVPTLQNIVATVNLSARLDLKTFAIDHN